MKITKQIEIYRYRALKQQHDLNGRLILPAKLSGYALVDRYVCEPYSQGMHLDTLHSLNNVAYTLAVMIKHEIGAAVKNDPKNALLNGGLYELVYPAEIKTEAHITPSSTRPPEFHLYTLNPLTDREKRTLESKLAKELGITNI